MNSGSIVFNKLAQVRITTITRSYDGFDRPAGYTLDVDDAIRQVAYAYDNGNGRLVSVSSGGWTFAYTYLPGTDRVSGYACGGFARTVAYEDRRDLIAAVTNAFNGGCVSAFAYVNDAVGRRTSIARSGTAFEPLSGAVDTYGYNSRSEVISSRRTLGDNPVWAFANDYAYDPIGNRTSSAVYDGNGVAVGSTYTANALNQYTLRTDPEAAFAYDDDGNMVSDGAFAYAWNGENRMVLASNAQTVVTFAYDHQGRMVRKTVAHGNADVRAVTCVWDGYNIVRETALSNGVTSVTENVRGLYLDGTVQGVGGVGGLLAVLRDGSAFLAAHDANGNVTEYVAAADGSVAAHYGYTPFGGTAAQSGVLAGTFTHRFSTKPWCEATQLYEYQFRKYSPELGRWMSRDPIGEIRCGNNYSFVMNNHFSYCDILGLVENAVCKVCVYNSTHLADPIDVESPMVIDVLEGRHTWLQIEDLSSKEDEWDYRGADYIFSFGPLDNINKGKIFKRGVQGGFLDPNMYHDFSTYRVVKKCWEGDQCMCECYQSKIGKYPRLFSQNNYCTTESLRVMKECKFADVPDGVGDVYDHNHNKLGRFANPVHLGAQILTLGGVPLNIAERVKRKDIQY